MLAAVPDPRARRDVRHRLAVVLALVVCAVLAGARSFTAIAEWVADADQVTREALGVTGVVTCVTRGLPPVGESSTGARRVPAIGGT